MVQRNRLFKEVDNEVRRYVVGNSAFNEQIETALENADPLTRELVFFRARGGDYRQAIQKFHISASTYHRRLRDFRLSLINLIKI